MTVTQYISNYGDHPIEFADRIFNDLQRAIDQSLEIRTGHLTAREVQRLITNLTRYTKTLQGTLKSTIHSSEETE